MSGKEMSIVRLGGDGKTSFVIVVVVSSNTSIDTCYKYQWESLLEKKGIEQQ